MDYKNVEKLFTNWWINNCSINNQVIYLLSFLIHLLIFQNPYEFFHFCTFFKIPFVKKNSGYNRTSGSPITQQILVCNMEYWIIFFFFNFDFLINSKPKPRLLSPMAQKKLFSHIEFTVQIFFKSITLNSVIFSFLSYFWGYWAKKKISKNLKLCIRYFLGRFSTYCVEKN